MRIYIHYDITDKPWGGGNSFLKAFKYFCINNNIELAKSINDEYDILFCNAASKSVKKAISIDELINIKYYGYTNKYIAKLKRKKTDKLIVYRSDGFRDNYASISNNIGDMIQKQMLHLADYVIFQNHFCLNTSQREHIGYKNSNYSIIFNGINQDMFQAKKIFWDKKKRLKIFSASWSNNINKGHKIIAKVSEDKSIDVTFCGRWPESIDKKNVNILEPKKQSELALEYVKHDVFLHPAKYDPSPNVCLEAISSGLPIIYHETSGIKEIASECGISVNEENPQETIELMKNKYVELINNIKDKYDFYSINRCALEYINLFNKLIDNK